MTLKVTRTGVAAAPPDPADVAADELAATGILQEQPLEDDTLLPRVQFTEKLVSCSLRRWGCGVRRNLGACYALRRAGFLDS